MPGRQCSTENREQDQHTRPVAGGQSLSAPEITRTAPLARFTPVLAFTPRRGTALQHTQSPEFSGDAILKIVGCILITRQYFPQWGECEPVAHTLFLRTSLGCVQILLLCSPVLGRSNIECRGQRNFAPAVFTHDFVDLTYTKNVGQTPDLAFAQPFGSIPCRRNSALANSFNQFPKLTPSRSAASFSCWRSSGFILIWKVGDQPSPLGVLSRFIVDTYVRNLLTWILLCTYVNTSGIKKTTPQHCYNSLGRLTKPLIGVTVMADKQHTREVFIPTKYEPLPVEVTYIVPPFDNVVETWQNKDPAKAYALFRQFIVDWDQQDKLTDEILMCFLTAYPGTDEAIFVGWCEHMKSQLEKNQESFIHSPNTIN